MKAISVILKVLGWTSILCLVIGAPKLIIREGLQWPFLVAAGIYALIAWLCFKGARKLKEKSCKQNDNV